MTKKDTKSVREDVTEACTERLTDPNPNEVGGLGAVEAPPPPKRFPPPAAGAPKSEAGLEAAPPPNMLEGGGAAGVVEAAPKPPKAGLAGVAVAAKDKGQGGEGKVSSSFRSTELPCSRPYAILATHE